MGNRVVWKVHKKSWKGFLHADSETLATPNCGFAWANVESLRNHLDALSQRVVICASKTIFSCSCTCGIFQNKNLFVMFNLIWNLVWLFLLRELCKPENQIHKSNEQSTFSSCHWKKSSFPAVDPIYEVWFISYLNETSDTEWWYILWLALVKGNKLKPK